MIELRDSAAGTRRVRVGITIGDPAGIGPEVSLKAAAHPDVLAACLPVLIGDAEYLLRWSRVFGIERHWEVVKAEDAIPVAARAPIIYNLRNIPDSMELGREQAACGRAAAQYIETAVSLCQSGRLDAIATAPINKKSLHLGGYPFPGHTEFLAQLTGTDDFAMTFFAPSLRVALLTTHVALADVPRHVKREPMEKLIRLVHREFTRYGFDRPRIAVAALNPHGGEGMLFG
ncbi:MAG: PdxA family dehydrogenase, partial [Gammaproteobacteria bacterium]